MTKADLVEEVIRVSSLGKKHAEIIVNTVFQSIIDALQQEDKIELRGFRELPGAAAPLPAGEEPEDR